MASRFAGLPPVAGVRAAGGPPADAVVSLRMADGGGETSIPLRQVQAPSVMRLTEVIVPKPGVYGSARRKAEDALAEFRERVDERRRKKW